MKQRRPAPPALRSRGEGRIVYGIHPVTAWLEADPRVVAELHYDGGAAARFETMISQATTAGVTVRAQSRSYLTQMANTLHHQGVVAACTEFPYRDLAELLAPCPDLLVMADQLQDPHNLGALIRTAEAAGAGGVVIPKDRSAGISPVVEMSASGSTARMGIARVTNIVRAVQAIKDHGYWVMALTVRGGSSVFQFEAPERLLVLLGGETGLRPLVSRQCDFAVTIPMLGRCESLNASVAAAVALFQASKRRLIGKE